MKKQDKKAPELTPEDITEALVTDQPVPGQPDRMAELESEGEALRDKWLRTVAEFENYRRRAEQEKTRLAAYVTEQLVLEMCDVLDNFDRAIDTGVEQHQFESFLTGVRLIHRQLADMLTKKGVERIKARGELFDPMVHDAVSHIPSPAKCDEVIEVLQNGYVMNGRVIRPAKVVVSSGAPAAASDNEIKIDKE